VNKSIIEIKKLHNKNYSWAVLKNGRHVNSIVKVMGSHDWVIWLEDQRFTEEESQVIADKLNELNAVKANT
jgi:hypothetical protein